MTSIILHFREQLACWTRLCRGRRGHKFESHLEHVLYSCFWCVLLHTLIEIITWRSCNKKQLEIERSIIRWSIWNSMRLNLTMLANCYIMCVLREALWVKGFVANLIALTLSTGEMRSLAYRLETCRQKHCWHKNLMSSRMIKHGDRYVWHIKAISRCYTWANKKDTYALFFLFSLSLSLSLSLSQVLMMNRHRFLCSLDFHTTSILDDNTGK